MPAYVISDVGVVAPEDAEAWKAYLALAPSTMKPYGGRYLVRGGTVEVLDGSWSPHAIVVVEFPDMESARRWYRSPEYAEALKIRQSSGLHRGLICVEGSEGDSAAQLLRS